MNVLLVEDDRFFQKVLSSKLKQEGLDVITASNGEEGLDKIKNPSLPDIILLDIIMPKKDGFEFLEEVSKDPIRKKIPVIVLSTLEQKSDIEKAKKYGVRDYFNKGNLDFSKLMSKIHKIVH